MSEGRSIRLLMPELGGAGTDDTRGPMTSNKFLGGKTVCHPPRKEPTKTRRGGWAKETVVTVITVITGKKKTTVKTVKKMLEVL